MAKVKKNICLQKPTKKRIQMSVDIDDSFKWLYRMNAKALKILSKRGF